MVTVRLLREGRGAARVDATFERRMDLEELFQRARPSQLLFCGTEPPTIARSEDDDDQDLIRVRSPVSVFVEVHGDPSGAFAEGFYFLMGVTPEEVKGW